MERRKGVATGATPLNIIMSALQNGAYPITLNGKEYGLLFSLNALDAIQEKFGSYDKLNEIFDKNSKDLFKNVKWLFALLINEARLAEDENAEILSEEKIGRMITAANMKTIQNAIYEAFAKGAAGDGDIAVAGESEDIEDEEQGETKAGQDN
jgi:hypothetical protein